MQVFQAFQRIEGGVSTEIGRSDLFLLQHLASFTMKQSQDALVPPRERLAQTKVLVHQLCVCTIQVLSETYFLGGGGSVTCSPVG